MIYWPFGLYFLIVVVLVVAILALSYILGQRHQDRATGSPFESGIVSEGTARVRVSAKFYVVRRPGYVMTIPLAVLGFLSLTGGFVETPRWLGNLTFFSGFMSSALPSAEDMQSGLGQGFSGGIAALAFGVGLLLAWMLYLRSRDFVSALAASAIGSALRRLWFADWGFDWLYDRMFVRPILWFAHINRADFVDALYDGISRLTEYSYRALRLTETGRVRWYAAGVVAGSVIYLAIVLLGSAHR